MAGVNKVIILGRLGQDPEVRMTAGGQQVCTMSVATSENWVKDGKKEERTEWHRVVLWGKQAELAGRYLKKGRNVYIEGRMQTRSWEDQQGQKRYTTEIVGNQLVFVDSTGGASRDGGEIGDDYAPPQGGGYDNNQSNGNGGGGYNAGPSYDSPQRGGNQSQAARMPDIADDDVPF